MPENASAPGASPATSPRPYRVRLLAILVAFALVPTVVLTGGLVAVTRALVPLVGASAPMDSLAATGRRALAAARALPLDAAQAAALDRHEGQLSQGATQARRVRFVAARAQAALLGAAVLLAGLLAYLASRTAGHLSRQLSRPLTELVDWATRIARGTPLPPAEGTRGAPEFAVLREAMRRMDGELRASRARALEAERLRAFRESAQQVAHELKNPLTPIRLALARVAREAPPTLADSVQVLEVETRRLEELARAFAQFGRLPEGPTGPVDLGELVRYAAGATLPPDVPLVVEVADGLPPVEGRYESLSRAVANLLLNAADAVRARPGAGVRATVGPAEDGGVRVTVADDGPGVPPDRLAAIWEPYVTTKAGGTGLGLAIVRQTVEAHGGAVRAANAPGGGLAIGFDLPARAAATAGARTP